MITASEVMPLFLAACPALAPAWERHLEEWRGYEDRGTYNDVSVLAHYLVEVAAAGKTECFPEVFDVVERLISEGDDNVRELAVVGLIEDIQNIAVNTHVDPDLFLPWLGPASRKGSYDSIRLSHGSSRQRWPRKI